MQKNDESQKYAEQKGLHKIARIIYIIIPNSIYSRRGKTNAYSENQNTGYLFVRYYTGVCICQKLTEQKI